MLECALIGIKLATIMSSSSTRELSACECPVCFLLLSGGRDPLSLPCGHTLCKVCVEQLRVQGSLVVDTFHCPLCRKLIKYESVSLNVTLKSLIGKNMSPPTLIIMHFFVLEELLKERSNVRSSALNVPYQEITFRHALDRGAYGEVYCGQWRGNEVAVKVKNVDKVLP